MGEEMIAVCGLDCGSCDIRKALSDPESAKGIVAWFRKEGGGKITKESKMSLRKRCIARAAKETARCIGHRTVGS